MNFSTAATASTASVGSLRAYTVSATLPLSLRKKAGRAGYVRELGHPPPVLEVEEARDVHLPTLLHYAPLLALRVLYCRLRLRRGIHVLRDDRARQPRPQSACIHFS